MRLILLLLFLAVASPAAAQVEWLPVPQEAPQREDLRPAVGEWHIGMDAGVAKFVPEDFAAKGTRLAVFAERQVHRWVAVQVGGTCSRSSSRPTPASSFEVVSLCTGVVSGVIPIALHRAVWPYLRLGYGVALWDEALREGYFDVDDTAPTLVAAAGIRTYLGPAQTFGFRVDLQHQRTTFDGQAVPHWSLGFGLSVRIPR